MKRIILFISCIMITAMFTSCGRTIRLTGENVITKAQADYQETTVPTTVATTVPVTEPATEGKPQHLNVNTKMPKDYKLNESCVIEGFETVMQEPELPTGCEITALAQTINFYGFDIDKVELCDVFMPVDYDGYYTMNDVYLGDPHSTNGFGCNAPVITNTANDYFDYIGSDWYAKNLSGISLDEVFYQIEQGRPVVIWTTIDQRETHAVFEFRLGCGEDFYFNPYQHCVTIYGYDKEKGIVNIADPLKGNVEYDMDRFSRIYDVMEQQAVVLIGNEESKGKVYTSKKEQKKWLEKNRPKEEKTTTSESSTAKTSTKTTSTGKAT